MFSVTTNRINVAKTCLFLEENRIALRTLEVLIAVFHFSINKI